LRESQRRFEGIVDSAMDAIISVNEAQRVVLFNAGAEQMFGCAAAEAPGQLLERFIPARFRATHRAHVRGFATTGVTNRAMGKLGSLTALRTDGREFPIVYTGILPSTILKLPFRIRDFVSADLH
jgi:PAS domain S-box-containing protein